MNNRRHPWQWVLARWEEAGPRTRIILGSILVGVVGLMGFTPNVLFGTTLSWPYIALTAAIGWGKSGFNFLSMSMLILFGFGQDISTSAPFGCFALINLMTLGGSVLFHQTLKVPSIHAVDHVQSTILLLLAFIMIWLLASLLTGHIARIVPIFFSFLTTAFLQFFIAPIFNIDVNQDQTARTVL